MLRGLLHGLKQGQQRIFIAGPRQLLDGPA